MKPNYVKVGYSTYTYLSGSKLVKLVDSTDIVTDKEDRSIPVVAKNTEKVVKFIPRGRNNNMMYDVLRRIEGNVTVGSNIEFNTKVVMGDGILVYRKKRNAQGKIEKEEVNLSKKMRYVQEYGLANKKFSFRTISIFLICIFLLGLTGCHGSQEQKVFEIPEPEKGGFKPSVDKWDEENGFIEI